MSLSYITSPPQPNEKENPSFRSFFPVFPQPSLISLLSLLLLPYMIPSFLPPSMFKLFIFFCFCFRLPPTKITVACLTLSVAGRSSCGGGGGGRSVSVCPAFSPSPFLPFSLCLSISIFSYITCHSSSEVFSSFHPISFLLLQLTEAALFKPFPWRVRLTSSARPIFVCFLV